MKRTLSLVLIAFCALLSAQHRHPCAAQKARAAKSLMAARLAQAASGPQIPHEHKYDVKFVHLDLNVEDYAKDISGNVKTVAKVLASQLDTFMLILHPDLGIDSIYFNGSLHSFIRQDSMVKVKPSLAVPAGASFTAQVWYGGTPPFGGAAIGDGFSNDVEWNYNQDVTWSLSESFVAYHWWPCKQVLTDKIDSSWVFVTTDSSNKAGSNGVLTNVVSLGAKKRYEWKSRSPIDYYLISVAVSEYKEYNLYAKPLYLNDSILIQNYVYAPSLTDNFWNSYEKPQINKIPALMEFYSKLYGMYPFYKEKYGHCMVPIGGGMEHQTMSSMGFMLYYSINAHELAHQWWGDNVTCKSWNDIWINEGFASYSEHLAYEYLQPQTFAGHLNDAHNSVMSFPGGSCYFIDTLDTERIFDSRLTYDKGGAIVHTLRFVTNNDSLWFNTLKGFQDTYRGGTASVLDFMGYYQTSTGIDPATFFNQWFFGEGYPTFNVKYNYDGAKVYLKVTQTTSMPSATPFFKTPIEYRIFRTGKPDTLVRLMHDDAVETYTINLTGSVNTIHVDPKNWLINKHIGPVRDATLGIVGVAEPAGFETITIGPNPSPGIFVIENTSATTGQVSVTDVSGRLLMSRLLEPVTSIDLSSFADGVYIINISDQAGARRWSRKVVKGE